MLLVISCIDPLERVHEPTSVSRSPAKLWKVEIHIVESRGNISHKSHQEERHLKDVILIKSNPLTIVSSMLHVRS